MKTTTPTQTATTTTTTTTTTTMTRQWQHHHRDTGPNKRWRRGVPSGCLCNLYSVWSAATTRNNKWCKGLKQDIPRSELQEKGLLVKLGTPVAPVAPSSIFAKEKIHHHHHHHYNNIAAATTSRTGATTCWKWTLASRTMNCCHWNMSFAQDLQRDPFSYPAKPCAHRHHQRRIVISDVSTFAQIAQ